MRSRCWAEINLDAIAANARTARRILGPDCGLIAVVKADAYGHGMIPVSRAIGNLATLFGVANVTEAMHLKSSGATVGLLILGAALSWERELIAREDFEATISSLDEARAFATIARKSKRPVRVHLAVDTGMGRMGIAPNDLGALLSDLRRLDGVELKALATHLPSADDDPFFTAAQLDLFSDLAAQSGVPVVHCLNSAGILRFSNHKGQMARAGLMLYGVSPLPDSPEALRPALAWKTRVTLVRRIDAGTPVSYGRTFVSPTPMKVATLGVGYADGYPRSLSGRGATVLIGGKRCPLLGRVTMDQIVVDVSGLDAVAPDDEAVLMGPQGSENVGAAEMADRAGTIPWEIFTGIQTRVERFYAGDGSGDI